MLPRAPLFLSIVTLTVTIASASGCGGSDTKTTSASTTSAGGSGGATSSSSGSGDAGGAGGAAQSSSSGSGTGGGACVRTPGPVDAPRFVVIGHGFDAQGNKGKDYEVLSLSPAGALAKTGTHFAMATPSDTEIVFTPDGKLGFTAQDDGTLGAFRVHDDGTIDVLATPPSPSYYAGRVVMSPEGDHLFVLDEDFPASGGGVYRVDIGCDDTLTDKGLVVASKNAHGLVFLGGSDVVLAAREALGATPKATALRLTLGATPALVDAVDAFGDTDSIVSALVLTHDGKLALIGDNSGFASAPNSVSVIGIKPGGLAVTQNLPMIEDPFSLQTSPFDDAAIVVSGFGDAIDVLDYAPAMATPFSLRGKLPYLGGHPQVPGASVMVKRGALEGRVLVAEVRGVFQVQFAPKAVVTDLGIFDLGGGTESIVSSIGVQP